MQLVEQHIIKRNSPFYKECDELCFKTKNLYNSCLYAVRQAYINEHINILYELHGIMKETEQYRALPAKVSSTVLLMVQKNFKSYFKALASFYKNKERFKGRPAMPKYLDTVDGRFFASYTNQAISQKIFRKSGMVKFSGISLEVKTKLTEFEQIDCARIIPKDGYYVVEVVHSENCEDKLEDNERYLGIDLGVNNFATITSNAKGITPFIINGRPLKSMNQFYNKQMAHYTSILEKTNGKKTSRKTKKLNLKRKNKIENYMHKASKKIVSFCIENNINSIVVGQNIGWKQDVNTGRQNNQAFVNIPHSRFIEMLSYKCELKGISFTANEESYTSKASFLNLDPIPTYVKGENKGYEFSGYRKHRGLYKIKGQNKTINADVNGSYNILRKAFPTAFTANGIEDVGVRPKMVNLS